MKEGKLYIDLWGLEVPVQGHLALLLLPDGSTAHLGSDADGLFKRDRKQREKQEEANFGYPLMSKTEGPDFFALAPTS